jgi:uncharacterized lipoprotein YajG
MKKLLVILSVLLFVAGCNKTTATSNTFTPAFVVDYNKCGVDPVISGNSVTFGEGSDCEAGRLVSEQGYVNITQIKATVDLWDEENFLQLADCDSSLKKYVKVT